MKQSKKFLISIRYLLLPIIIMCGLVSIIGTGGGGGGGTSDDIGGSSLVVTVYDREKAYPGTTFFTEGYNNRLVEVDMDGNITWEYAVPGSFFNGTVVGFDAEILSNGHILLTISNSGLYEIDREGTVYWSYEDPQVSHDADRLRNGNTLFVFGANDAVTDLNVKEVTEAGTIAWSWNAADDYLSRFPPDNYANQGWAHVNGVQRLNNGRTLVSLRNFFLTTILDQNGNIDREYDWSAYGLDTDPHDPVMNEDDGTLVVCLQNDSPYVAVEIDAETEEILWSYSAPNLRTTRDCNKLPNGNYLLVAVDEGGTASDINMEDDLAVILEVTPDQEVVWRLELQNIPVGHSPGWFYKAERTGT